MEIGIIGSGNIGGTLLRHLTSLGHQVSIANSRGPASLSELADETGATAATVEEAARGKDIVIVTIPEKAVPDLPSGLLTGTSTVIIDTGNYYPSRDGSIAEVDGGMTESEWVSGLLGRRVVKAFNNIAANSLATKGVPAGSSGRVALPVAGDDPRDKKIVMRLIEDMGFDAVDAGTLADSWRQQPGTPVYAGDMDAEGVKSALAEAEAGRIAEYRAEANEAARRYFE